MKTLQRRLYTFYALAAAFMPTLQGTVRETGALVRLNESRLKPAADVARGAPPILSETSEMEKR